MHDRRANAGAAVLDEKLYVAGGTSGDFHMFDEPVASVEMFDPRINRWSRMAGLPTSGPARLVTMNGKLYAFVTGPDLQSARI